VQNRPWKVVTVRRGLHEDGNAALDRHFAAHPEDRGANIVITSETGGTSHRKSNSRYAETKTELGLSDEELMPHPPLTPMPAAAGAEPPSSSLERDFCRRRLARQKGPEDDVSAQGPEIGDHHTREMAAKTAFLLAGY
jgi:hypothetical protein